MKRSAVKALLFLCLLAHPDAMSDLSCCDIVPSETFRKANSLQAILMAYRLFYLGRGGFRPAASASLNSHPPHHRRLRAFSTARSPVSGCGRRSSARRPAAQPHHAATSHVCRQGSAHAAPVPSSGRTPL